VKNISGAPVVNLKNYNIKVSLSHCKDKAVAFAICTGPLSLDTNLVN